MIGSFTEVKPLYYWVQHILPLVYDDSLSYMELLGKVINTLNEVVKNNNLLPDYIMGLIKDYISSGEIEKVLADVLANYMLNVKFPPAGLKPATGDGSADDTEAIQGCIDYAYNNGGMSVYFPSGSYLTQPLTLRNKATLFGQDRYTTRLIMKGGATTAMFTGDIDELTLTGLGFDGNMDIQVNNVNLFTISVNSAIITNCLLTDGYDLLNVTVNDNLQLNDVIFRHAVENSLVLKGTGIVQGNNLIFKSVSALVGKNFVVMDVSKSILEQLKCYGASPNAVLINGNNNIVKMWNEQSLKAYTDNGVNNTVEVYTHSEQKKLTGFKTTNISGNLTETVGGDKTETITGNKKVSANSSTETIVNEKRINAETVTETISGDKTETITGNKNVSADTSTETIVNEKRINAETVTETIGGDKTETITGNKKVSANSSTETIVNEKRINAETVTETISGDKTETITGNKNVSADTSTETIVNEKRINAETVTETIGGDKTETITGNKKVSADSSTETIVNEKRIDAGTVTEDIKGDKTTTAIIITENSTNKTQSIKEAYNLSADSIDFSSKDFIVDSVNPFTYKKPSDYNRYFKTIPFKDLEGNNYDVLVKNEFSNDYFNIKDYGAKGDGIADDSTSIQNAIIACYNRGGGTVIIPSGNYSVSKSINLYHRVSIVGENIEASQIRTTGDFPIFIASPPTGTTFNVIGNLSIKNLYLVGSTTGNQPALKVSKGQFIIIDSVKFVNAGIYLFQCAHVFISNFFVYKPYNGLIIDSGVRHHITSFEIALCRNNGIEIHKTSADQITDVIDISNGEVNGAEGYGVYSHDFLTGFVNWKYIQTSSCKLGGWRFFNQTAHTLYSCYAEGGSITNSPNGFSLEKINNFTFENCVAVGFVNSGVLLSNSSKNRFVGLRIWYIENYGVMMVSNSQDSEDNKFVNCAIEYDTYGLSAFFSTGNGFLSKRTIWTDCRIFGYSLDFNLLNSVDCYFFNTIKSNNELVNSFSMLTDASGKINVSFLPTNHLPILTVNSLNTAFDHYKVNIIKSEDNYNIGYQITCYDETNNPIPNITVYGICQSA